MHYVRGHTPTLQFRAKAPIDFTQMSNIYVTLTQGGTKLRKTGDDVIMSDNTISVFLNQEESLRLYTGNVEVDINWTFPDGRRGGNDTENPIIIKVTKTNEGEVLE